MMIRMWMVVGAAALLVPLAAQAACDTEQDRELVRIHYSQAMAAWQENDPLGYEAAQEQMKTDAARARHGGEVRQCQFWQNAIKQVHKQAQQAPPANPMAPPAADEDD
jgi:hypothetical protein